MVNDANRKQPIRLEIGNDDQLWAKYLASNFQRNLDASLELFSPPWLPLGQLCAYKGFVNAQELVDLLNEDFS